MIGVKSYADKAIDAVARNLSAVERARERLAAHDRDKPAGDDADALFAWGRDRRDLEDRAAAAAEALTFAKAAADKAAAELVEREADKAHRKLEKTAAEIGVPLVRSIEALSAKLGGELQKLEDLEGQIKAANTNRGSRPFIQSPEFRVRQRPGEKVEEIATWDDANVDADGNPVAATIWDKTQHKTVRNPACVGTKKIKAIIRPAMQLPARMPHSYRDEIRLVDAAGLRSWPVVHPDRSIG